MMRHPRWLVGLAALISVLGLRSNALAGEDEKLFVAKPFTEPKSFTAGIEGPACDREGNVYAVNFGKDQTIGKVTPKKQASIFITLPGKSTGNGIVFDKK